MGMMLHFANLGFTVKRKAHYSSKFMFPTQLCFFLFGEDAQLLSFFVCLFFILFFVLGGVWGFFAQE